ncbi:MAG: LD-carboxypeptidase [Armatimonadetes bacterium]|nr:LD-carboxypeptidase [Armatimonadota bacterium]
MTSPAPDTQRLSSLPALNLPRRLPPGGTVGVISPASPCTPRALEMGLTVVREAGFQVVLGEHLLDRRGHLAGADEDRASDLTSMFLRDDVDAVLCARGGSGAIRLLPLLDWDALAANPKPFLGYSDITILQLALLRRCRMPSFFAPMPASDLARGPEQHTLEWLWRLVCRPEPAGSPADPRIQEATALVGGVAEGPLVGGTLSLLVATLGTPFEVETQGRILFLEDIHESPARMERYLLQLRLAGKLDGLAGLLLGVAPFEAPEEEKARYLPLEQVYRDLLSALPYPVVYGWPLGHLLSPISIPQGIRARLDAGDRSLAILEPAVTW